MNIEHIQTGLLNPYVRNSRIHSETQIRQIAASIQEFGFTNPILIDNRNEVIAGHGRLQAAQILSLKTVPCIRLSHLTEQQRKAYVLADNQIALNSEWDEALLLSELTDLSLEGFDFGQLGIFEDELKDVQTAEIIENVNTGEEIEIPAEAFITEEDRQADEVTHEYARITRYERPKTVRYEYAEALAADIGKINENEHIDAIVSGNFIAGDFIEAYLRKNDLIAEEIIISTLSMSSQNVDSLKLVQQFHLTGNLGLIISDYFFSHERKDGIEDIIKNLSHNNFYLAVAGIHTKITLIKTTCGMHIVIGGSANLRSSLNIEQITLDNNKLLYNFHRQWMSKILNQYYVNHKLLRREKLWQLVQNHAEQKKPEEVLERQH
jgi:hypothetical protein